MPNANSPQILITPLKPALILGMAQKLPVLVRIQAPDPEPGQTKDRRPYHLSLVIDRSGSMSGEPLLEAVRCAKHIVDRLDASDVASLISPQGEPIAFPDAALSLKAMSLQAWETLIKDPLVVARQAELAAGNFLDLARATAEHGDWDSIRKMIIEGRTRFTDHPWVTEILESMAEIAREMDGARFRKEARYSSRKMNSRVAAKEEILRSMASEAIAPSFLRRKKSQGKAQFEQRPENEPPH